MANHFTFVTNGCSQAERSLSPGAISESQLKEPLNPILTGLPYIELVSTETRHFQQIMSKFSLFRHDTIDVFT